MADVRMKDDIFYDIQISEVYVWYTDIYCRVQWQQKMSANRGTLRIKMIRRQLRKLQRTQSESDILALNNRRTCIMC